MAEQLVINRNQQDEQPQGLNWARIVGIAFVIALHAAAFLLLLIPAVAPPADKEDSQKTIVTIVDAPPPPPPPPPPPEKPPEVKELKLKPPTPDPKPIETPPPPAVVDVPQTHANVVAASPGPPVQPAPPVPSSSVNPDGSASVCSRSQLRYPPAAQRSGATGTTVVLVSWNADGTITDVSVQRSSRNRDLDRAATQGVKQYKVCPGQPGSGTISVDWQL